MKLSFLNKKSFTVLLFFIISIFGFTNQSYAQSNCTIGSIEFSPLVIGENQTVTQFSNESFTNVKVTSSNCNEGLSFSHKVYEEDYLTTVEIENMPSLIYPDENIIHFQIEVDENTCFNNNGDSNEWGWDCISYLEIKNSAGNLVSEKPDILTKTNTLFNLTDNTNFLSSGAFVANCTGTFCLGGSDDWIFQRLFNGNYPCDIYTDSTGSQNRDPKLFNIKKNQNNDNIVTYPLLNNDNLSEFVSGDISDRERKFQFKFWLQSTNGSCLDSDISFDLGNNNINSNNINKSISIPDTINFAGDSFINNETVLLNLPDICNGNDCQLKYSVNTTNTPYEGNRVYNFTCGSSTIPCNETVNIDIEYVIVNKTDVNTGGSASCNIESVNWVLENLPETSDTDQVPIIEGNIATLEITFQGNGCSGETFELILNSISRVTGNYVNNDAVDIDGLPSDRHFFVPPTDGEYKISFGTGDDECSSSLTPFGCMIGTRIERSNGDEMFESKGLKINPQGVLSLDGSNISLTDFLTQKNLKKGLLYGNTDPDMSLNNWKFLSENGLDSIVDGPQTTQTAEPEFDADSPCIVDRNNPSLGYKDDCYEFLAPIPGFGVEQVDSAGVGTGRVTVDLSTLKLGDYLNQIFQIALGILMVLSVIMIVVGGVQYMTTEAIFQKSEAKDTITKAIAGLILGLGIFIILNTINPRLREIDFGEGIDVVSLEVQDDSGRVAGISGPQTISGNRVNTGYIISEAKMLSLNIYCPGSGGSQEVKQIAESFEGKVAYRFGGRGSDLGAGKIFNDGGKNRNCGNQACNNFCPDNNLCIDCSAFISHVLDCAGLTSGDLGGTDTILGGKETINMSNSNLSIGNINGIPLNPGDLIGKPGHIAVYIGNGEFAESSSSNNGRLEGNGVQISNMSDRFETWKFDTVRRLPY